MWALYTLKWTLVTLVLMGHYLTYESLRHNQLYFTFKRSLEWWPLFPPALSFPTHLPKLADNCRAAELNPRLCITSFHPPHCHLGHVGVSPSRWLGSGVSWQPMCKPCTLSCFLTLCATLQESHAACWSELTPRKTTVSHLSVYSLFS